MKIILIEPNKKIDKFTLKFNLDEENFLELILIVINKLLSIKMKKLTLVLE